MTEQPNREVVVLNAALELRPEERAAYLDQACAGDAALRRRVEELLKAHTQAEGFLDAPPAGLDFKRALHVSLPPTEKPGDRIGRYKLLQQIGEGGCGIVYMAEQEEPVRRRVALKVIKLGMDTKQVIARFEAERQALALMDHPNITKVLDAGATNTGRPYFVMELVRGVKITDFCDENKLSTGERLKLFIQVCQAVQHAHQKGVIHRDLKPSNILVTVNDDEPVPKVIDFGIAKATQGRLTDQTLFTAFEQFMGTPAYMSPEQAVMTSLDIDTRSDIYSLGVLLYELLTGRTPFDQKELLAAGLDEMRRTIREKEPARPSTRLSKLLAAELTTTARQRKMDAPKLIHFLRGDLDCIVMKCLEKDRKRRYETVNGLAMDARRFLEHEPVTARPPSRFYRLQKTIHRNKGAFAAAAVIALVMVVGAVMSRLEAMRATRAELEQTRLRQIAETKEKRSKQTAQFLKDMLASVAPKVALGRDTRLLHDILDNTAERVGRELQDQPEVQAELLSTIGSTYMQLFDLDKAEVMEREVLRLRRTLFAETNEWVAASLTDLARVLVNRGSPQDLAEAEMTARQALAIQRTLSGHPRLGIAYSLYVLGAALQRQHKSAEAELVHREALAMRRALLGDHPDVASSLNNLALVLRDEGKWLDAEATVREAVAMEKKLFGNEHPDVGVSLKNLSIVLRSEGKLAEAETVARESLAVQRKMSGDDHPSTAAAAKNLREILLLQGRRAEAELLNSQ